MGKQSRGIVPPAALLYLDPCIFQNPLERSRPYLLFGVTSNQEQLPRDGALVDVMLCTISYQRMNLSNHPNARIGERVAGCGSGTMSIKWQGAVARINNV